ncbi:MAG: hypothetical protein WCX97_05385 [Candidatus Magasanikbacteria bacterium]|jgi:hypothetical protein
METRDSKKIGFFSKISLNFNAFCDKTNKKYKENLEFKASIDMLLDIISLGILVFLSLFSFGSHNIILKIIGFGSLFWLIKEKVVPLIVQILNSFRLVQK